MSTSVPKCFLCGAEPGAAMWIELREMPICLSCAYKLGRIEKVELKKWTPNLKLELSRLIPD
jgi:hypothetical protein